MADYSILALLDPDYAMSFSNNVFYVERCVAFARVLDYETIKISVADRYNLQHFRVYENRLVPYHKFCQIV